MLRDWVVRGGGLDGYYGEQELPVSTPECLERFTEDALTISGGSLFQNKIGDGVYNISVGGTCRRGRVALVCRRIGEAF